MSDRNDHAELPRVPGARTATAVDKAIGKRIAERRQELGMSLEVLAQAIGVAGEQLRKYETGANRVGAARLLDISTALNARVEYFFADVGDLLGARPSPTVVASGEELTLLEAYRAIPRRRERTKLIEIARILARD